MLPAYLSMLLLDVMANRRGAKPFLFTMNLIANYLIDIRANRCFYINLNSKQPCVP